MDITERLRAQEAARAHLEELAHAARLNTMGELASGLAHELNQPLAAVRNYIHGSLLRLTRGDHDSLVSALHSASEQADRAARIIRRLREMMRKRPPRRHWVGINALVDAVLEMVAFEARRNDVKISADLDPDLPQVWADAIQIEQVILNLVRNGIEALQSVAEGQKRVSVSSRVAGDWVEISVQDTGPGVPSDDPDRVFDPFYSTKQEGMGMGLPISRTIIESHGGALWADGAPTGGTCFRFRLPITAEEEEDEH
jgi:C4-dicarboxylate-specific signal transduction histidine kinase